MRKSVNIEHQTFNTHFFLLVIFFLISSCKQNNAKRPGEPGKKDALKPPFIVAAKAPFVTRLDTCPPPLTITIPGRKEDSFVLKINNTTTVIHSPEIKPADFSVLMQNYNTEQGLGYSSVTSGCLDKSGNLWFGTFGGGVSRYDGKLFTTYTAAMGLVNNLVTSVFEDNNGSLWFGTIGGVNRYNGKFFKSFTISQGLVNDRIRCIAEDKKGNIWFGTSGGVSKYDGKSFTNYTTSQGLINNGVTSILQDKSGNIWFGTSGGVSRYDGKNFRSYSTTGGLVNNYVTSMLEDKNGNIWFGTTGGVCRLDPHGSFKNYTAPMELANKSISGIMEDKLGYIWFATNEGVFRLKGDGSIINLNTNRGLSNNKVNCVLTDKSGNIWFCTDNGISRFDQEGKFFVSYTTAQGLSNNAVVSFCEDKSGDLWFGTYGGGVSRLDRDRNVFTNYSTAQGLPGNVVRGMAEDKMGNLWFGTDGGGVCQLDHARKVFKIYTTQQGLPDNSIRCITEDKNGDLWFGTATGGVSRLDHNKKYITTYTTHQGLSSNSVRSITEDKTGNHWFNTLGGGISRLDQELKFFTNYTTAQGLAHNYSWPMLEDTDGNLWAGTEAGVSRYDGISFANYSTSDGLSDEEVSDIAMDKEGIIWLGTNKGFNALKGFVQNKIQSGGLYNESNLKPSNGLSNAELKNAGFKPVFENYNKKTGYPGKQIEVMGVTREGIIWAGTGGFLGDKLISFDFRNIQKDSTPPVVFIQGIKVHNEFISWYGLIAPDSDMHPKDDEELIDSIATARKIIEEGAALGKILSGEDREIMREKFSDIKFDDITPFYPLPVNLVLPYRHNNITFDFAAIEPARPYLLRYQYMLEDYDSEYGPVTDKTSASFGNVREGNYTFKLKAQSPDGVWSEPLVYTFKVLPPWYRTFWAYAIYTAVFLIALWIFIKWRVRKLKTEKILLEEKVAKRTHELQEEKEKVESTLIDLKSTQAQLIQSEKMASLGELTAGIAHEIQNPLNFVNNFSEVNKELIAELKAEIKKGNIEEVNSIADDIEANEEKINHHGKRADGIVKGMLQHSRVSSGQKEPTNINALADEYLRLAYHGIRGKDKSFNATLKTDYDETLGNIKIIPQDIGRVLLNLYNNAFYAVNSLNQRQLAVERYAPVVTVSTKKIGEKVVIKVADNGTGIPQKVVDKIFQPFFTTKPTGQGTGLGLSLSYDIIKAHGGEIKVETKEGEGAEFLITLPT